MEPPALQGPPWAPGNPVCGPKTPEFPPGSDDDGSNDIDDPEGRCPRTASQTFAWASGGSPSSSSFLANTASIDCLHTAEPHVKSLTATATAILCKKMCSDGSLTSSTDLCEIPPFVSSPRANPRRRGIGQSSPQGPNHTSFAPRGRRTNGANMGASPGSPPAAPSSASTPAKAVGSVDTPQRRLGDAGRGDVALCVRLRPGSAEDNCVYYDGPTAVRVRQSPTCRHDASDPGYRCDHAFGPEATQEQVFAQAVQPICDAVLRGYNGAVIAYGQTGSGKTFTMVGDKGSRGMAPRAVAAVFTALARRPSWSVEVSVLEIYNERVRDLLVPGPGTTYVDIHEDRRSEEHGLSFRCPDATRLPATCPEDALSALSEGMRRRETARTDMNHNSSRSHLIFTLTAIQTDCEVGATLHGRLHLVDLAGSERLKRSMSSSDSPRACSQRGGPLRSNSGTPRSPRDQRKEAGEINKSLSQLALVIQRLTTASMLQYVPYRDSMLTRLLADSFGGSSKTCLIITASGSAENREETRCSLEFGKRAKLVKNKAEINLEVTHEPSPVMRALVAKELVDMMREKEKMQAHIDAVSLESSQLKEQLTEARKLQQEASEVALNQLTALREVEEEKRALHNRWLEAAKIASEIQETSAQEVTKFQEEQCRLQASLSEAVARRAQLDQLREEEAQRHSEDRDSLEVQLAQQKSRTEQSLRHTEEQQIETGRLRQLVEEKSASVLRLDEECAKLRTRWLEDTHRLERERASAEARLGEEKASIQQKMQEMLKESSRLQDEKMAFAQKMQEEKAALHRRWQEDVLSVREEKAKAVAALEEEKVQLHRRWQEDVVRLQEAKAAAINVLEREKASLRQKWQEALDDTRKLQAEHAGRESQLQEEKAVVAASLHAEKVTIQQQCAEEIARSMEDKASEAARIEKDRVALHRWRDDEAARIEQERGAAVSRLEAEKASLQQKWHEATADASRLLQERASLLKRHEEELEAAKERWQEDLSSRIARAERERSSEVSHNEDRLAKAAERRQQLESEVARLQEEVVTLRSQHQAVRTNAGSTTTAEVAEAKKLATSQCTEGGAGAAAGEETPIWCVRFAEQGAALRRSLETANSDATRLEEKCNARLAELEDEAEKLRRKWHLDSGADGAAGLSEVADIDRAAGKPKALDTVTDLQQCTGASIAEAAALRLASEKLQGRMLGSCESTDSVSVAGLDGDMHESMMGLRTTSPRKYLDWDLLCDSSVDIGDVLSPNASEWGSLLRTALSPRGDGGSGDVGGGVPCFGSDVPRTCAGDAPSANPGGGIGGGAESVHEADAACEVPRRAVLAGSDGKITRSCRDVDVSLDEEADSLPRVQLDLTQV
eukprot:gnl/TRDRNA2_/TRDRNA2_163866_c0_seq1.p1 gnl/TRDRNA2_/TRDRNA2_163866_c0~~gnl/TRDRNA2_/TRDRNA2_163866_c0_seq1.p1  ORF type:complete len:1358 (+),score=326.04 gnl/TRDRNA2_/TRDRNA2_163866_c0_seq1:149-4222(+)